jgi:hypothetical protein
MAPNFGYGVSIPTGWLTARHKELRAAFKRMVPHRRLTVAEKQVLSRAVALTAKAELAALDPDSDHNDVVRLDGAAELGRARRGTGLSVLTLHVLRLRLCQRCRRCMN